MTADLSRHQASTNGEERIDRQNHLSIWTIARAYHGQRHYTKETKPKPFPRVHLEVLRYQTERYENQQNVESTPEDEKFPRLKP